MDERCPRCDGVGTVRVVDPGSLRHKREMAGLGLREMARRLGISAAYLCDIEKGRRRATEPILKAYKKL